jgi:hypothetical protein
MSKKNPTPFGLLFEEPTNPVLEVVSPLYDETEDITVILDDQGNKIPYVEWYGLVGTKTTTRIAAEGADDDDDGPQTLGTRTLTEVKKEGSSDFDDMSYLFMGTKTSTSVSSEQADEDRDDDVRSSPKLYTMTATKTAGEGTDNDE